VQRALHVSALKDKYMITVFTIGTKLITRRKWIEHLHKILKGKLTKPYLVTVHEEVEICVDGEYVGLKRQQA